MYKKIILQLVCVLKRDIYKFIFLFYILKLKKPENSSFVHVIVVLLFPYAISIAFSSVAQSEHLAA